VSWMGAEREGELVELLAGGHPPAFATDSRDRIVFCNSGAARILGRRPDELIGLHCYEAVAGRDVFGNRFCYANCPVMSGLRAGECIAGFEVSVSGNGHGPQLTNVTIVRVPSVRPDLFTVVHILQPIAEDSRLGRLLERFGTGSPMADNVVAPPAVETPPLTAREREVLQAVATGLQNKEVADKLGLSLATVRNHVHNILEKLSVHSKLEAVSLAFRKGWVTGPSREGGARAGAERTAPGRS
jgi:DNA-binding CsgD family transcriptional regulator